MQGSKCLLGIISIFWIVADLPSLSNFKLSEDAFGDKVEDVSETLCLIGCTWEVFNEY